jgi:iron complex transport system substrate-binding protein
VKTLALLLLVVGCDRPPGTPGTGTPAVDSRGKTVLIPARPERIVSLAPSTTELLFDVGAGEQIAGVTTYCEFPPEARSKPKIGDLVLDLEKLSALRPDLVVTAWSLTQKTSADLEGRGYAVFGVDPQSFEDIAAALASLGTLTGHAQEGRKAAEALRSRVRAIAPFEGPTFYFEHSADPLGTTGPETYTGRALRQAGGRNIFDGAWLNAIDWEAVMARDPQVILIAHDRREGLERRAGWKKLRAVREGRVYFVPKEHYVYPTPRLVEGLEEASRLFHEKSP